MYIYELKDWPVFSWDQPVITNLLINVRYLQGQISGRMESIGFSAAENIVLQTITQDVVKSSEIEGEILDQSLVRSSVARHLGIEEAATHPMDKNIEGVVEMSLDATQNYSSPLTKERLLDWHASLFPSGFSGFSKIKTGAWRPGPVDVVSGRPGKEKVHFEAPASKLVNHEMTQFLKWLNSKTPIDLVLKAAICHLWFVTIHPFEDGNGRIGRAIADLLLARSENSPRRFYSLSAQIQKERQGYYAILEKTQKGTLDITAWLEWFLSCLERSIKSSLGTFKTVLKKGNYWKSFEDIPLNERQRKVINLLLESFEGKLTSSKWAKLTKCSQDTASRDILDLVNKGILQKNPEGGRSTSYSLVFN